MQKTALEAVLGRDRLLILAGLGALTALSWCYLLRAASGMAHAGWWGPADFALGALMWWVMMAAMMIPSAAQVTLAFAALSRRRRDRQLPYAATGYFLLGYLVVWAAFSVLAAGAQWTLQSAALLSGHMLRTGPVAGGLLLAAAGVFQWTPLKEACLRHCRSPLAFLLAEWRDGAPGAFLMGARHGKFCLGCCWFLMLLPFAAGVMNLFWMAALTGFILVEKLAPQGDLVGRVAGLVLLLAGVSMVTLAFI